MQLRKPATSNSRVLGCPAAESRRACRMVARAGGTTNRQAGQIAADAQEFYAANKRPWCQPSTILLTGTAISAGSWRVFGHGLWSVMAIGATAAVLVWWYLFLVRSSPPSQLCYTPLQLPFHGSTYSSCALVDAHAVGSTADMFCCAARAPHPSSVCEAACTRCRQRPQQTWLLASCGTEQCRGVSASARFACEQARHSIEQVVAARGRARKHVQWLHRVATRPFTARAIARAALHPMAMCSRAEPIYLHPYLHRLAGGAAALGKDKARAVPA